MTPDPFIGIAGLAGICSNGAWIPTELVETEATVEFREIEGGYWVVRLDDGRVFAPLDGLATEFRTEGRRVTLTGKVRIDLVSLRGPIIELLQIQ